MTTIWPYPSQSTLGFFTADIESNVITPQELGVTFTHCMGDSGKGGVTIAWRKTSDTKNARMVEVALAYCSPADTFTKKIGKKNAWESFMSGMTVLVPARSNKDDDSIPANLREMFWYSLGM